MDYLYAAYLYFIHTFCTFHSIRNKIDTHVCTLKYSYIRTLITPIFFRLNVYEMSVSGFYEVSPVYIYDLLFIYKVTLFL